MNNIADMHLIAKWKLEMHKWFNKDLNTMIAYPSSRVYPIGDQEKRFIDILDSNKYFKTQWDPITKKTTCTISPIGYFNKGQPCCWETKNALVYKQNKNTNWRSLLLS